MILKLLSLVSCHWKLRSNYFKDIDWGKHNSFGAPSFPMHVSAWTTFKMRVKKQSICYLPSLLCQALHHLHQLHCPQSPWILVRNLIPHPPWHRESTFAIFYVLTIKKCSFHSFTQWFIHFLFLEEGEEPAFSSKPLFYTPTEKLLPVSPNFQVIIPT